MTIQFVTKGTIDGINDVLLDKKPDIVQFVGHGIYKNSKGYLALVSESTGKADLIDEDQFSALFLGVDNHLGLVCLAACESATSDSPPSFLGIAPKIVQKGIPAVIAMQYSVQISSATIFLENFYKAIASRKPVDWAVQAARRAVSLKKGFDNREFATPVLYMRAKDGEIF
jgi:CHAT domain-containing protein